MLPSNLENLRLKLSSNGNKTIQQIRLLKELNAISELLDMLARNRVPLNRDLMESMESFNLDSTRAWGADPARCELCGK